LFIYYTQLTILCLAELNDSYFTLSMKGQYHDSWKDCLS
jgi:hypothetical protein